MIKINVLKNGNFQPAGEITPGMWIHADSCEEAVTLAEITNIAKSYFTDSPGTILRNSESAVTYLSIENIKYRLIISDYIITVGNSDGNENAEKNLRQLIKLLMQTISLGIIDTVDIAGVLNCSENMRLNILKIPSETASIQQNVKEILTNCGIMELLEKTQGIVMLFRASFQTNFNDIDQLSQTISKCTNNFANIIWSVKTEEMDEDEIEITLLIAE